MRGAIIMKIGDNSVTIPNHFENEESAREFLLDKFYDALKSAEEAGLSPQDVSIKLDPNFIW